jgi:hypothetical protein
MLLHQEICKYKILAELADQGQHRMDNGVDDRQYLVMVEARLRLGETPGTSSRSDGSCDYCCSPRPSIVHKLITIDVKHCVY